MKKYQQCSQNKGLFTFYLEQSPSPLQKENTSPQRLPKCSNFQPKQSILPSRKRIVNPAPLQKNQQNNNEIVDKFLLKCLMSKQSRKCYNSKEDLKKITEENQQDIYPPSINKQPTQQQSVKNTPIQPLSKRDHSQYEDKKDDKIFGKSRNSTEKLEHIPVHIRNFFQENKGLKMNPVHRNIPPINLSEILCKSKGKAKSEQRTIKDKKVILPSIEPTFRLFEKKKQKKPRKSQKLKQNKKKQQFIDFYKLKLMMLEEKSMSKIVSKVNINEEINNDLMEGWSRRKKQFLRSILQRK